MLIDSIHAIICKRPLITETQTNILDWQWGLLLFTAFGKAERLN